MEDDLRKEAASFGSSLFKVIFFGSIIQRFQQLERQPQGLLRQQQELLQRQERLVPLRLLELVQMRQPMLEDVLHSQPFQP
jgi:hypothetical protein